MNFSYLSKHFRSVLFPCDVLLRIDKNRHFLIEEDNGFLLIYKLLSKKILDLWRLSKASLIYPILFRCVTPVVVTYLILVSFLVFLTLGGSLVDFLSAPSFPFAVKAFLTFIPRLTHRIWG
jgi:hypothetical protein